MQNVGTLEIMCSLLCGTTVKNFFRSVCNRTILGTGMNKAYHTIHNNNTEEAPQVNDGRHKRQKAVQFSTKKKETNVPTTNVFLFSLLGASLLLRHTAADHNRQNKMNTTSTVAPHQHRGAVWQSNV